jgi:proteasome accessory factor B
MDNKQTQVVRQWKLIRLLSESPLPLKTIAERLKTTTRTINRDLATLQQAGVPLTEHIGAHGLKHWTLTDRNPGKLSTFSYDEAAALYLGRRFLEPLTQTFLWEAADSALKKVRSQLGSQPIRYLDRLLNVFRTAETSKNRYIEKAEMIDALILGCEEQREVVIAYRALSADEEETYTIRPYEMEVCGGTIYVTGFSCKSNGLRLWKLDRMSSALATDVKFAKPVDYEFIWFAAPTDPPQKVRILFDSSVARFVQEHCWHESEKITERPDGSLLVEYELRETVFIKKRLLSYGSHAEVLEPASLREQLKEEIDLMAKRYASSKKERK